MIGSTSRIRAKLLWGFSNVRAPPIVFNANSTIPPWIPQMYGIFAPHSVSAELTSLSIVHSSPTSRTGDLTHMKYFILMSLFVKLSIIVDHTTRNVINCVTHSGSFAEKSRTIRIP